MLNLIYDRLKSPHPFLFKDITIPTLSWLFRLSERGLDEDLLKEGAPCYPLAPDRSGAWSPLQGQRRE